MNLWQLIIWKTNFLTTIDDWIRLATMSIIALLIAAWLDLSGIWLTLIIAIGVAIDAHDVVSKAMHDKPIL